MRSYYKPESPTQSYSHITPAFTATVYRHVRCNDSNAIRLLWQKAETVGTARGLITSNGRAIVARGEEKMGEEKESTTEAGNAFSTARKARGRGRF